MIKGDELTTNYGCVEVIEYNSSRDILVRFKLTGYEVRVLKHNLLKGSVKDPLYPCIYGVGFNGVGKHITNSGNRAYRVWMGILCRCYTRRYPSYSGCSVYKKWHNFQVFAEWYDYHYIEGYHLDKDIKIKGNRIYSPDTCMFVTRELNSYHANLKSMYQVKLVNDMGEVILVHNVNEFCRNNNLSAGNINMVIHGKRNKHKGWRLYNEQS